ncbi:hypothetical protein Cni_G21126 [Canna indica]|uniref:SBP-type domain-containing protein n=1 Tax=Canna indica TaxID=4628 RepID=A0AAQ3QLE7_9LILI|nr:hypothetical protein Cni_G21126 [Canna indica]
MHVLLEIEIQIHTFGSVRRRTNADTSLESLMYYVQACNLHSGLNGRWQLYDLQIYPNTLISSLLQSIAIHSNSLVTSFKESQLLSLSLSLSLSGLSVHVCAVVSKLMEMSSSSLGASAGADDSLHGLMFGKKIYFEDGGVGGGASGISSNTSKAPPAPPRKGRTAVQGGQQPPPRCQVEGCEADLTGVKAYYCRHKVCGMHSKAPKVIVGGMEQRFCQQCSRFHQLTEFDQGKRSCRRRLAGHNERRRKPPPGPFASRYGQFAPSFHEPSRFRSFLMDFSYPKLSTAARNIWPTVRPGDEMANNQWHGIADAPTSAAAVHGTHPYLQNSAGRILYSSSELPPGGCVAGASDASCALSLLSTQPWGNHATRSQVPSISASSSFNATPMVHSFISNNYMADTWGFRDQGSRNMSQQTRNEIGASRADDAGGAHFSGELELALQGNGQCLENGLDREYDHHSGHIIHWSL